jgi:hypothetical protein
MRKEESSALPNLPESAMPFDPETERQDNFQRNWQG